MKIGIVTDSISDIPQYLVEQYELEVVPTILILEGRGYLDGKEISRDEFYKRLPSLQSPPTTAAPSIGEFLTRYESLLRRGCEHILSIHPAGQLTTIVNVARQAAADFAGRITVIDSRSLSMGLGFQTIAAAEAAESGLEAALEAIESTRRRTQVFAALDTMEYLRRSGRVPRAVAALGGLLSIKPLIELIDGEVKAIGATRTTHQANERMFNLLREGGGMKRLAILHTGAEARAQGLLNVLMQKASQLAPRNILTVNVAAVIGAHIGPNGLGFAAVRA